MVSISPVMLFSEIYAVWDPSLCPPLFCILFILNTRIIYFVQLNLILIYSSNFLCSAEFFTCNHVISPSMVILASCVILVQVDLLVVMSLQWK